MKANNRTRGYMLNIILPEEHSLKIIELSRLLNLHPNKVIVKALEKGLSELRRENKEKYICALERALEFTDWKLRAPF